MGENGTKKNESPFLNPAVLAGLIAALAAIIAAYLQFIRPTELAISATQTAEARQTQIAAASSPTATRTIPPSTPTNTPTPSSTLTASPPTPTKTMTATPPPTLTPTCPYQGKGDAETLTRLIQAEAEAANKKNLGIITAIFAPDAKIIQGDTGRVWNSPDDRYANDLFKNTTIQKAMHDNPVLVGPSLTPQTTEARMASGSSGEFYANGNWTPYDNPGIGDKTPYGSDQWVFRKNRLGCWVIVEYRFNAGHIPFP